MVLDPRDSHSAIVGHQRWSTWDIVRGFAPWFVPTVAIATPLLIWWVLR